MKKEKLLFLLAVILISIFVKAQTAFHNFGNVQIHDQGEIGFHIDLQNDGTFNQNLGFAGFYNINNPLSISGSEIPRFFDMEVDVEDDLFLLINTEVFNSLTYTNGLVITPRIDPNISLDFLNDAIYILEDDTRHTDGYASYFGNNEFIFPIGDDNSLRPLITPFQTGSPLFSAAYFNEDPNFPSTFSTNFDTTNSESIINTVSINEFWDFSGTEETQVTLTWDQVSNIQNLVDDLINLRVVGWSISENRWLDLGNTNITGNINSGTISSIPFIPNDFEVITFGALIGSEDLVIHDGISSNGDGVNDFFVIKGIELFENTLEIFNRLQRSVFKTTNYQNDWNGISNTNTVVSRGSRLPAGVYYYVLNLPTEGRSFSGPIYITN